MDLYVSFPQAAVDSYTQANATAYASTHDVGNTPAAAPSPAPPASSNSNGSGTDFCSTHTCIPNFANGTGYIVQCADGEWSQSGGRPGACSYHGGETSTTWTPATTPTSTPPAPTAYPGTVTGTDGTGHNIGISCSDNPNDPLPGCNDGNGRGPADNLSYGSVTGTDSVGYHTGIGCSDNPNDSLPTCQNG